MSVKYKRDSLHRRGKLEWHTALVDRRTAQRCDSAALPPFDHRSEPRSTHRTVRGQPIGR
eukprot:8418583-Pyramimonas_sp.AAC.1